VKKSDMEKLALATGGKIVTNIEDLTPEDLGEAALVEERRVAGDKMVFVEGCKNPKSVSILIRGGLERLVDEAERSIIDALSVVSDVIEDPRVVYGGGAIETEISKALRKYAATVGGREQLAIEAFAKGIEAIPRTLAENAGGDPIDALAELKSLHEEGKITYGINGFTGKPDDMAKLGVIEPASVKIQAISSGTEAAATLLRIDDIIAASKISKAEKGPEKEKKEEEEKD
jgi:chaperonin GroEL (HSP60 family)